MADNFVTCRHCGIGINYACDHEEGYVPAEEHARVEEALRVAEALLLDIRDSHHREGWEPTETFDSVMERLTDWRWNNGYDEFNPPLRPDPRGAKKKEGA